VNRFHPVLSLALLVVIALPELVMAHPGHGRTEPQSFWHYVSEPLHGGALWGAALIVTVIAVAWRRFARRRDNVRSR